ncbi:hypothetical protein BH20VER2_BH20VER2_01120 [soil metagenome]
MTAASAFEAAAADFQPAMPTRGKRSLINLIDGNVLMKRGQQNGLIMFQCGIGRLGFARGCVAYRGTEDVKALSEEVLAKLDRAEFFPAKRAGKPVPVVLHGTVMYAVIDGKPRIRVFLNQEDDELKRGGDYIAPQLILEQGEKFRGFDWPAGAGGNSCTVTVAYDVAANGSLEGARMTYESKPGLGFGSEVIRKTKDATFIPGFRNGKPAAIRFTMPFLWRGLRLPQWGT